MAIKTIDQVRGLLKREILYPVQVTLGCDCLGAAATLLVCGIATMAYLCLPPGRDDDRRGDFEDWVERYLDLGRGLLTPTDLYASRCGLVHTRTTDTNLRKQRKARPVVHVSSSEPPVSVKVLAGEEVVLISLEAFREALEAGIDQCLEDLYADAARRAALEERLELLLHRTGPDHPDARLYDRFFGVKTPWDPR